MKFSVARLSSKASAIALAALMPLAAHAHHLWLLPSATVLSGNDPWVTVDAAVSNNLFYFEHFPLRLDGLVVTAPDGTVAQAENAGTGHYRSVFDVHLTQDGTYRIAIVNRGVNASYNVGGEKKRWRGSHDALARALPADARDVTLTETGVRVESFVTRGKPTMGALAPTGQGLELDGLTHPNDLAAGSAAHFRLLKDGKPAPNVTVGVVPGGVRYRDRLENLTLTTDAGGKFDVKWPSPGMYWMEAEVEDDKTSLKDAKRRRLTWAATFEVLPQ